MVSGLMVFLLTAAGLLPVIPTAPALLISLGAFFIGMGEWRNHPLQTRINGPYKITGHPRAASLIGTVLDFIGMALSVFGLVKLFQI